jgi:hypothetical protein
MSLFNIVIKTIYKQLTIILDDYTLKNLILCSKMINKTFFNIDNGEEIYLMDKVFTKKILEKYSTSKNFFRFLNNEWLILTYDMKFFLTQYCNIISSTENIEKFVIKKVNTIFTKTLKKYTINFENMFKVNKNIESFNDEQLQNFFIIKKWIKTLPMTKLSTEDMMMFFNSKAGSGKTFLLTTLSSYLININYRVYVLTPTNKSLIVAKTLFDRIKTV